jgi:hypothetical protein
MDVGFTSSHDGEVKLMHTTRSALVSRRCSRIARASAILLVIAALVADLQAQDAINVPFVGKNHLSFYTTKVSRDGIGDTREALYGGTLARRFGERAAAGELSLGLRAAARSFEAPNDGIIDPGLTLAATRAVPQLPRMNATVAAGVGFIA